jgi:hypothetical protein
MISERFFLENMSGIHFTQANRTRKAAFSSMRHRVENDVDAEPCGVGGGDVSAEGVGEPPPSETPDRPNLVQDAAHPWFHQ